MSSLPGHISQPLHFRQKKRCHRSVSHGKRETSVFSVSARISGVEDNRTVEDIAEYSDTSMQNTMNAEHHVHLTVWWVVCEQLLCTATCSES